MAQNTRRNDVSSGLINFISFTHFWENCRMEQELLDINNINHHITPDLSESSVD